MILMRNKENIIKYSLLSRPLFTVLKAEKQKPPPKD